MDESEVYDQGWSTDQESVAMGVISWMDGEADEDLVDEWKPLVL